MTSGRVLEGRDLAYSINGRLLFEGVSLTMHSHEFLVLGGVNGAGKTTLLRLLSGELEPSGGAVAWAGLGAGRVRPRLLAQRRAYLAQQTTCALPFRALEVVLFGAEAGGLRGGEAVAAARAAMEQTGTRHLEERQMFSLSGGEAQRLHWARVLAQLGSDVRGKVLFLDEPISSLDLAHQHELLRLARVYARKGAAVIAVLHDLNLAAEYADRLMFLHKGGIYADGAVGEVLTRELLEQVFGVSARVSAHPSTGRPYLFVEGGLPAGGEGAMISGL